MNKEDDLILNFITGLYRWVNAKLDDETLLELEEKIKKGGFEKEDFEKYKEEFLSQQTINKFNISPQLIFNGLKNYKSRRNLDAASPYSSKELSKEEREKNKEKLNNLISDASIKQKEEKEEGDSKELLFYEFYDPQTQKFSYGCKGEVGFSEFKRELKKDHSCSTVNQTRKIKKRGEVWTIGYDALS